MYITPFTSPNLEEFFQDVSWFPRMESLSTITESISREALIDFFWDDIKHFSVQERMEWYFALSAKYAIAKEKPCTSK